MEELVPTSPHDYLHGLYDRLNETPMQRKFRSMAPMPIGCVFIQWPDMTEEDIRGHFRTIRATGFTCLKGIMVCPGTSYETVERIAIEEGLSPWWYDQGGWQEITPELLEQLGLPRDMEIDAAMTHPAMLEYQTGVMRQRIERHTEKRRSPRPRSQPFLPGDQDENAAAGQNKVTRGTTLFENQAPQFVEWLKKYYPDVDTLKTAWNVYSSSHGGGAAAWQSWEDVAKGVLSYPNREFRHLRDILRFKADFKLERLRTAIHESLAADPNEPMRAGGEISIFLPHTATGIDMEGYAEIMADGGAFYPSMHPGWHLEEVGFELVRPTFMQASMCVDWAKGVWSAPFESTGGPQWWSGGGKVPFVPEAMPLQPAFTITEHTMTQLICSYLGAGFKGFGLWCWNPREASWEAGEYSLCDRNNQLTPRALRVGQIGQAMVRHRRELWNTHKEPQVGLLQEWENDAMWGALATIGRERYKNEPTKARIGAARALINANIPWEHVTLRQLEKGLAPRYQSIYLPATICLPSRMIALLTDYVRQGGRVVLDMPGAYLDERAHLIDTRPGSAFEQLFGAVIHEYAYANNEPFAIGDVQLQGFTVEMTATTAQVVQRYDNGKPAITENKLGQGTAVILGAEASMRCLKPGNVALESLLAQTSLGAHAPLYRCDGALVYRQAAPAAD
ncbi:MAG: beta-galactosidase trimerization domain-containing protein, partial [bacterium]